ncbi:purine-nucleoside phosphorylase [Bacillus chungangensis]|uniref:Purine nucleoside phosphorylase n=1 Tax=Bacillus chungangensis TaxID=587633 RepID=A0ABT9WXB0_9BACI|nr:purine-nucleoside phosphorylase [Bacillus chungangensis]MDQ0177869.1 purine-nucleoside phosphorylase [Bacillus chungangensis]
MNFSQVEAAAAFLQKQYQQVPSLGFILGSGLGILADEIENPLKIKYDQIPHFPVSTVKGHAGQLVFGQLNGKEVVMMQGRFHYYEGYSFQEVAFPVRVMKQLGVEMLIVTNAAGGINEQYTPGDFMLISDHINLMGGNPLIGPNIEQFGDRFPDMSEAYNQELRELAKKIAKRMEMKVQEGVYVGNTGPVYETPAEVKMARILGGDAVGMSTVPEVIAARHARLKVLGISCISNMAAGILDEPLTHEEVIETTDKVRADFIRYLNAIVKEIEITR